MNSLNKTLPEQQDPSVFDVVFNMIDKAAPKKKRKGATITGSTILDDIGMDSLELLDVAMNLEEHYDLFIPDEDINAFCTLQDISDYLEKALAAKPEPDCQIGKN